MFFKPGTKVIIHYARNNPNPEKCWREMRGIVLCQGRGPGPRSVLVSTEIGTVVVPAGNIRAVLAKGGMGAGLSQ